MRKKGRKQKQSMIDVYIGGERDPGKIIIPKKYGRFFNKKYLFLTLIILVIMLLLAEAELVIW